MKKVLLFTVAALLLIALDLAAQTPANNDCSSAISLSIPSTYSGSNIFATTSTISIPCSMGGGTVNDGFNDVWFTFVGNGEELQISTCDLGTDFDTQIAVLAGNCSFYSCVAGNDDYGANTDCILTPPGQPRKSELVFESVMGTNYLIRLDGASSSSFGSYTLNINELTPAPIQLVDFWGDSFERGNSLAWETSSEVNVEWHIIERSADGRGDWSEVSRLQARGSLNQGASYDLIDSEPFSKTFYRLKTTDYDGSEQLSPVISISRAQAEFQVTKVYPNPIADEFFLQVESEREEEISIRAIDLTGSQVMNTTRIIKEGFNEMQVDVTTWKPGVYFLQLRSRQGHVTRKITVQR